MAQNACALVIVQLLNKIAANLSRGAKVEGSSLMCTNLVYANDFVSGSNQDVACLYTRC